MSNSTVVVAPKPLMVNGMTIAQINQKFNGPIGVFCMVCEALMIAFVIHHKYKSRKRANTQRRFTMREIGDAVMVFQVLTILFSLIQTAFITDVMLTPRVLTVESCRWLAAMPAYILPWAFAFSFWFLFLKMKITQGADSHYWYDIHHWSKFEMFMAIWNVEVGLYSFAKIPLVKGVLLPNGACLPNFGNPTIATWLNIFNTVVPSVIYLARFRVMMHKVINMRKDMNNSVGSSASSANDADSYEASVTVATICAAVGVVCTVVAQTLIGVAPTTIQIAAFVPIYGSLEMLVMSAGMLYTLSSVGPACLVKMKKLPSSSQGNTTGGASGGTGTSVQATPVNTNGIGNTATTTTDNA